MDKVKKIVRDNWRIIALAVIIAVAIFLRTYRFHDWLEFRYDQARDAYLVNDVMEGRSPWPMMGPKMSYTGEKSNNDEVGAFHLGPIYYYFQIISAKIFGDYPDKLAYPDLLFSILSVPLLYFFLKIYFSRNLSLYLTGLYAISAYFIRYSRMAWNSNSVPFFALLFMFSLYKFLEKNEKTPWMWVILTGIAMGVGFQLHVITMALFTIIAFLAFVYSMKKNRKVWKGWAVVLLIFVALNSSQIISEITTNFSNTRSFFNFPVERNVGNTSILALVKNDIVCHIEANFLFLSSYGNGEEKCSSYFSNILPDGQKKHFWKNMNNLIILLASLGFSIAGFGLLFYYNKNELDKAKKYFLRLIILYFAVGFIIMFFISSERMSYVKYLRFDFFMPYIFLGFLVKFFAERFAKIYVIPVIIIFFLLIYSNIVAISKEAIRLLNQTRTCDSNITTLGEVEPVAEYLIAHSNVQSGMLYFDVDSTTLPAFANSLEYLFKRRNISSYNIEVGWDNTQKIYNPIFILGCKLKKSYPYPYTKINSIYVYQTDKL